VPPPPRVILKGVRVMIIARVGLMKF
jgi:hypothetical protein